jgi:hypothetical protein
MSINLRLFHNPDNRTGTQIDLRDDPAVIEKLAKQRQSPITPKQGEQLAKDLNAVKWVEHSLLCGLRLLMGSN